MQSFLRMNFIVTRHLFLLIAIVVAGCGTNSSDPVNQAAKITGVHVVGIYESLSAPPSPATKPAGDVNVVVSGAGAVALVLSSYEATRWVITTPDGAVVKKVYVSVYTDFQSSVSGVSASLVVKGDLGFRVYERASPDWSLFIASIKSKTGLSPLSFQGAYTGSQFTIKSE